MARSTSSPLGAGRIDHRPCNNRGRLARRDVLGRQLAGEVLGVGEVVRHEQHEPGDGLTGFGEAELERLREEAGAPRVPEECRRLIAEGYAP